MNIKEERQRILELWYNNIKPEARGDLSNLWEHRQELGELEAIVEDLEPKVIKLLEVIPTLKRHSHEYHARTVDLVKLLHHFNKYSKDEWIQKVTSDLDYMSKEITQARNQAEEILKGKMQKGIPTISEDFANRIKGIYHKLLGGQMTYETSPITIIILKLNEKTYQGSDLSRQVYYLDQTTYNAAPFIGFCQDGNNGLLYPSPVVEYTESMNLIFNNVRRENARREKSKVTPLVIVRIEEKLWKVVSN
ncbi:hypothetical protein HYV80_03535 [Candidatus Woesearchaeota archaeon]|nr:hypothetical protein [Candidatus Woesearchaeota archaeon]